jgi:hypothetical protein
MERFIIKEGFSCYFHLSSSWFKEIHSCSQFQQTVNRIIVHGYQLEGKERSEVRGYLPSIEGSFHIWCKLNWPDQRHANDCSTLPSFTLPCGVYYIRMSYYCSSLRAKFDCMCMHLLLSIIWQCWDHLYIPT